MGLHINCKVWSPLCKNFQEFSWRPSMQQHINESVMTLLPSKLMNNAYQISGLQHTMAMKGWSETIMGYIWLKTRNKIHSTSQEISAMQLRHQRYFCIIACDGEVITWNCSQEEIAYISQKIKLSSPVNPSPWAWKKKMKDLSWKVR